LACGTGNIGLNLERLGYAITGIDASAEMVRVASQKAMDRPARFLQRDLRDLEGLGPFDAAVCMYDSFNYLLTLDEVDRALGQITDILQPGGALVFDVCTERNSLRYFRNVRHRERGPNFSYERHSYYDPEERLQYNHFQMRFDGRDQILEETHSQRIYALADLKDRLALSSFELLDVFADFTFSKGSEEAERLHFVLRVPGVWGPPNAEQ
jgi:SAM-dependent methyltransferase